ncbi:MAG: M48 family metallopeptidase [Thermodesulfobacteriota bacterium]|nr:M48 family metallopeptidase [Thermodesulfobacteriota bacterium]
MRTKIALFLCIVFFLTSCATVPVTGRRQLSLISSGEIHSMSFKEYDNFLSQHKVIKDTEQAKMVKNIGKRIQKAVEKYFAKKKMSDHIKGYKWEFNLVDEATVNAWCMPGGKVVVYSGILPITQDETGLAVVMGHEIAHAVANHGKERMSQGLIVQMGGAALSQALSEKPEETHNLFLTAYGVGTQVGLMLPYSRLHESEADRLGLIFMAMAGYDPHAAVDFWRRMSGSKGGSSSLEFLSTHPSDKTRIKNLKQLLPEALGYYKK